MRRAFTLVELLVAIGVMAILAGMVTAALGSVNATARRARCETQLTAMNVMLQARLEDFLTLRIDPGAASPAGFEQNPWVIRAEFRSRTRLINLRDQMRMELPDRINDLRTLPVSSAARADNLETGATQVVTFQRSGPSVSVLMDYRRTIAALRNLHRTKNGLPVLNNPSGANWADGWSETYESSECLYLILASTTVAGRSGLSMVREDQITDLDNDGIPEVVDSWGTPFVWMRWPVGYWLTYADRAIFSGADEATRAAMIQSKKEALGRDQFDLLSVDPRLRDKTSSVSVAALNDTFNVPPVIVSAGPDREFDLMFRSYDSANAQWQFGAPINYATLTDPDHLNPDPYPLNYYDNYSDDDYDVNYVQVAGNPFAANTSRNDRGWVGAYYDVDGDQVDDSADNIYSVSAL